MALIMQICLCDTALYMGFWLGRGHCGIGHVSLALKTEVGGTCGQKYIFSMLQN